MLRNKKNSQAQSIMGENLEYIVKPFAILQLKCTSRVPYQKLFTVFRSYRTQFKSKIELCYAIARKRMKVQLFRAF